jgi:hypothetical protein
MSKTLTLKGVVESAAPGASRTFFDRLRRDAQKKESAAAWTTDDELEFLANLGTFAPNVTGKMLRSGLLARYREAIARRAEWGRVDRVQVETALALMDRDGVR